MESIKKFEEFDLSGPESLSASKFGLVGNPYVVKIEALISDRFAVYAENEEDAEQKAIEELEKWWKSGNFSVIGDTDYNIYVEPYDPENIDHKNRF